MSSGRTVIDQRFELIEPLGSGGMGTVWRAYDLALHREVALKEVRTLDTAAPDRALHRERVLREARAVARIGGHPNVVTVHHIVDTGEHEFPWIVMELVRGRSLSDLLADGPLPPGRVAGLGRGILAALRAAHAVGVLHRDVKPANVLVRDDGTPVLTDFGIAAISGMTALTATGGLVGSLDYVAPERLNGIEGDPASDLWSLGLVLFFAVEGYQPMRRESSVATLATVISGQVPAPQRAGALSGILGALLVADPRGRPDPVDLDRMLADAAARETGPGGQYALPAPAPGSQLGEPIPHPAGPHSVLPPAAYGSNPSTSTPAAGSHPGTPLAASGSHPGTPNQAPGSHPAVPTPAPGSGHGTPALGAWAHPTAPAPGRGTPYPVGRPEVWTAPTRPSSSRRNRIVAVAGGATLVAVVVAALLLRPDGSGQNPSAADTSSTPAASVTGVPTPPVSATGQPGPVSALHVPENLRAAVAALESATGGTEFTRTTIYPDFISTGAPVPTRPTVYDEFDYRDGRADRTGPGGDLSEPTVRLSDFDWDTVPELFLVAERDLGVPEPTSRYLIVEPAWTFNDDRPTLLVYVSDDYGGGYLAADPDGTIVDKIPR
ncbi:serine/threonine-protein kinase [Nocardia rhizosphaerae]|uniref:non-specific serine/threonine protein kinase n=1 Tax=Nocardia rhizosphaerae TaxID=1691571 RepID=A0ABV8KZ04_9NOCA